MDIKPIKTEADNEAALAEIEALWGADPGTPEGDKLDVLVTLVEAFEEKAYPIEPLDPIETIKASMREHGRAQKDFAELIGSASRASEVLNRKRALTVEMIDKIATRWRLPADILVKPYHLEVSGKIPSQAEHRPRLAASRRGGRHKAA